MKSQIDQIVLINFKKHKDYKGEINGNHFIISGANGEGKTTVFDAIKRLIGVRDKDANPGEPITKGAENSTIGLYLSNNGDKYYVEEKFTKGKNALKFYKVNGGFKDELRPALERLQAVIGNPIDFSGLIDMSGLEQMEFFKTRLGLDLSIFEHKYENLYDDRTLVNREVSTMRSKLDAPELRVFEADKEEYKEYKDAADLMKQRIDLTPIQNKRSVIVAENNKIDAAKDRVVNREQQIMLLNDQVDELQKKIAELRNTNVEANTWLKENPPKTFTEVELETEEAHQKNENIDEEVRGVSEWNKNVDKVKNYLLTEIEYDSKKAKSDQMTRELKMLEGELLNEIKKIPVGEVVEGLELVYETEEVNNKIKVKRAGLLLEGLPFNRNQHSYGKMLKSLVLLSAHFNEGKLNFIPIGEWNLLDEKNQKEIIELAKQHPELGIQLGIELVNNVEKLVTEIIEK